MTFCLIIISLKSVKRKCKHYLWSSYNICICLLSTNLFTFIQQRVATRYQFTNIGAVNWCRKCIYCLGLGALKDETVYFVFTQPVKVQIL